MFFGQLVFRFCLPHKCKPCIFKGSLGGGLKALFHQPSPRVWTVLLWGGSQLILSLPLVETTAHAPGVSARQKAWEWGTRGRKKERIPTWKIRVTLSLSKTQVFKKRKGPGNIHSLERRSQK